VRRAWQTWAVFGACLLLVLLAVGWVTRITLRLERSQMEARREAEAEEAVRLALWRMDSGLATLIARESARPYFVYRALYPAEGAYASMFDPVNPGEPIVPSPLLIQNPPHVLLHFQLHPDGSLTSPQAPAGDARRLAQDRYVSRERIEQAQALLARLSHHATRQILEAVPRDTARAPQPPAVASPRPRVPDSSIADSKTALLRGKDPDIDRRMREQIAREAMAQNTLRAQASDQAARALDAGPPSAVTPGFSPGAARVIEGALTPLVAHGQLLLARRVIVSGAEYIQGCWLDWPAIKGWLLPSIRDLLPAADLEPVTSNAPNGDEHLLASLPVRLVPGSPPASSASSLTPVRVSLLIVWSCLALAGLASALLLLGTLTLAERRAAFTSAVTHELRTPLTTFRMYAEMLASGMVVGEEQRREYLETLSKEAERLSHLVENVLAYARLEKNSSGGRRERVGVQDLLERTTARLQERVIRAGMSLQIEADVAARAATVVTDASAVEQILFNLVDNACKYAADARDQRIHLQAAIAGRRVLLRVRDHGPGIAPAAARRLFRPFSKSAREAANTSVPGVGLGLALSRRLARRMGGDLYLEKRSDDGACFVLALPAG